MREVFDILSPKRKEQENLGLKRNSRRLLRESFKRTSLTIENLEHRNLLASVPVLVDDLNTTTNGAQIALHYDSTNGIHQSVTIAGVTYFTADDGVHGSELWRSNGTETGTRMVKDLNTSITNNSSPRNFVNANGTLYFIAQDNSNRAVLYKSNGTAVGTQPVSGIPSNLQVAGGLAAVGNNVFFTAQETGNTAIRLWVTDGSVTKNLTSLGSTAGTIASSLRFSMYNVNEKLVFFGNNGAGGIELWASDGTVANTTQVTNLNPGQSFVNLFNGVTDKLLVKAPAGGDRLYFVGLVTGGAYSMFMTDGTTAGTQALAPVIPSQMASVGGLIYFQAQSNGTTGYELWRTDGTTAGTRMVADIVPGYGSSYPQGFVGLGTTVYFSARATDGGPFSYWKTDGTTVEPVSFPDGAGGFTAFNNSLFFSAVDPALGRELFKLDASGVISILDIAPGAASSNPRSFQNVGSSLMFVASSGSASGALWSTAGDIALTKIIKDINQTTQGISPTTLIELNGQAYFADQSQGAGELFRTDGTPAGTVQVTNIRPGELSANIYEIVRAGDALYFAAFDTSGQRNLWKYDGHSAELVFDDVEPSGLREFDGKLYFSGRSRTVVGRVDLWTSDGTNAGTHRVEFGIRQGSSPAIYTTIGGDLFFRADQGYGDQLYRSDRDQFQPGGQIDSVIVQPDGKLIATGGSGAALRLARFNADGSVDPTFGQSGRVVNSNLENSYSTSVIQSDGKIVVGSSILDYPGGVQRRRAAVVRLMPDGSYDTSFGSNGVSIITLPGTVDGVSSLALQNIAGQQKIVFSTETIQGTANYDMAVVRLNPDGSLDNTFGGDANLDSIPDGFVITDVAGLSDYPSVLLVSPVDQKIIIAGSVESSAGIYQNAVLRYTANGVLDTSYGTNGVAAIANSGSQFESASILADGSVIAAGDSYYREIGNSIVVKLDPSGQLDTTFGDAGSGITFVRSGGEAEGIVQLPGGDFAFASRNSGNSSVQATVYRLNSTGQLDTSFGNAGFTATNFGEQFGQAWTLSLQSTGGQPKLIVAGSGYTGSAWRWGMARMDLSGTLDSSFGNAGIISIGAGSRKFSDDLSGTGITRNSDPIESGGHLYFMAEKAALGTNWQLWVQPYGQGTPIALTSTATIGSSAYIQQLTNVDGMLFFNVLSGVNSSRHELWKSDGTVAGTVLVSVLETSSYVPIVASAVVGGAYYFTMARAISNEGGGNIANELWVSSGTAASTRMVDSVAASNDSWGDLIQSLRPSNGKLFYQKFDAATGFELWTHDGTASRLVADISPGPNSSYPYVYDVGGETYVAATTPALGTELWHLLDDSNPATTPTVTINDGVSGTVEISRIGNNLMVAKDGQELASYAIGTIVGLTIQGDAESEVIIVDIDGLTSAVLPQGISIAAGEGIGDNDTLILSGSRTVSNYNYTTGGREAGSITLDGFTVLFTEFEPIVDQLNVVNRSFEIGTSGDQQIVLAADGGAGTLLSDGGMGTFESLSFASPSGSFKIVAGDRNDSIIIQALDPSFAAELTLDGGLGNDVLNASDYNLSVALLGGPGNDVLLGGSDNDHIDGGDGNDLIDGGAGIDATDGGSGIDDIIADAEDGQVTIGEDSILNLTTTFVDPVAATINWGDDTTVPATVEPSAGKVSGTHVYLAAGIYHVTVTAVDSAGTITTKAMSVTVMELIAKDGQVFFNSTGIVRIGGTSVDDQIVVASANGKLTVTMNGSLIRGDIPLAQVSEIRAWGHAGNDTIRLVDLAILSMVDGGAGDDELEGGAGDDLLLGGAGNDMLVGGAGNDFLVGGWGFDRLVGAQGRDILVADDVDRILSREDLRMISANWVSGKTVDDGLLDNTANETPIESGLDRLTGGSGSDWFIVGAFDFITDFKKNNKDGDIVTTK